MTCSRQVTSWFCEFVGSPYSQINAGIVRDLATGIATAAPKASILVISNPVNSTVPIVVEVLKKHGVFDPKKCA